MRLFARLLVGLRGVVPLVWIGAAVAATLVLPSLGATGSAPLDDLVAPVSYTHLTLPTN